jgi:hypothetical protein
VTTGRNSLPTTFMEIVYIAVYKWNKESTLPAGPEQAELAAPEKDGQPVFVRQASRCSRLAGLPSLTSHLSLTIMSQPAAQSAAIQP